MSVQEIPSRRLHLVASLPDPLVREPPVHELVDWIDRGVLDVTGRRIGVLVDVGLDERGRPRWLIVDVGERGARKLAYVAVRGSSLLGESVLLAHDQQVVEGAPDPRPGQALDTAMERRLHDHYATPGGGPSGQLAQLPPPPLPFLGLRLDWTATGADAVLVRISGELDAVNVEAGRVVFDGLLDCCDVDVVIDLAGLGFVSCRGLDLLVHVHRRVTARGRRLRLRSPSLAARRLLGVTAAHHPQLRIDA